MNGSIVSWACTPSYDGEVNTQQCSWRVQPHGALLSADQVQADRYRAERRYGAMLSRYGSLQTWKLLGGGNALSWVDRARDALASGNRPHGVIPTVGAAVFRQAAAEALLPFHVVLAAAGWMRRCEPRPRGRKLACRGFLTRLPHGHAVS